MSTKSSGGRAESISFSSAFIRVEKGECLKSLASSLPPKFFIFCCICKCFPTEPAAYAAFVETVPFVRTQQIGLRLSRGKGNSTLQGCNVEPSRCHNEDMRARAGRNKSEST